MATGMTAEELIEYMRKQSEAVNEIRTSSRRLCSGAGFAIPIPEGTNDEVINSTERSLLMAGWSFDRVTIRDDQHFVLFPYG